VGLFETLVRIPLGSKAFSHGRVLVEADLYIRHPSHVNARNKQRQQANAMMTMDLLSKPPIEAEALAYLRRESLDIYNRLHSIDEDTFFVLRVRETYPGLAFIRMLPEEIRTACFL
jgi:hypothetical protein